MSTVESQKSGLNVSRTALKRSGLSLLFLSFQTLGIIYSDIGTSPLYVLNGIWPSGGSVPSEEDVIGGISAIFWSLTLLPLLKYVFIALRFGTTEGEGGTFALFHGLFPPKHMDLDADRTLTGDTVVEGKAERKATTSSSILSTLRVPLLIWSIFGTSLTMADGIFTPAVSVTSAVGGIAVAKASVENDIIPISIAFLVALFLVQRFGTSRLSFIFAPVTFIWLALIGISGIVNIVKYPGIFRAIDPSRAILLFVRTGNYDLLAGVLLAITGCEALFANLGQFNMASIQIAFGGFVYPCLILAYFGQGARLIVDGENVLSNMFYQTIPGPTGGGLYWFTYVMAILATLIASQAMISATFSLVQQIVNLKSLPSVRMIHTSETIEGQIYIPVVNWILMALTVIVVGAFQNLTNMTNAYGFAVATVMFTTSVLITFQIVYVKHLSIFVALLYFIPFGFFDGLFWGAGLRKVPTGAWVPLMIGVILATFMLFWTWAKGLEDGFDGRNRQNLRHFIMESEDKVHMRPVTGVYDAESDDLHDTAEAAALYYIAQTTPRSSIEKVPEAAEKRELARIPTCAVFHKLTPGQGIPHSFVGFIRQYPALPRVVIFLSVRVVSLPRVNPEDRYQVTKVRSIQGFYGVTYCLGFRDHFDVQVNEIIEHICKLEFDMNPRTGSSKTQMIRDCAQVSTHIVPHYHVVSKGVKAGIFTFIFSWIRALLIETIYRTLTSLFPETGNWLGSADEIIHVGINAVI